MKSDLIRLSDDTIREYFTIESPNDFYGWRILTIEAWKPGVKRVHLVTHPDYCGFSCKAWSRIAYCKDEYLDAWLPRWPMPEEEEEKSSEEKSSTETTIRLTEKDVSSALEGIRMKHIGGRKRKGEK